MRRKARRTIRQRAWAWWTATDRWLRQAPTLLLWLWEAEHDLARMRSRDHA